MSDQNSEIETNTATFNIKPPHGSMLSKSERRIFKELTCHRPDWSYDQLSTLVKVVKLERQIVRDKAQVKDEGRTQRNGSGTLVLHPLIRDIRENEKLISSFKRYVGFGTSSIPTTIIEPNEDEF